MPVLLDKSKAPLPSQRQNGLVFATAADICQVIRCVVLEFEAFVYSRFTHTSEVSDSWIIDRYDLGDGVLVPAVLPGDVPDDYTPKCKGVAITVQSNPRTLKRDLVGQNASLSGNQWAILIKDRSGRNVTPVLVKLLKDKLFKDGFYIPQPDLEENDARVPTGVFLMNLFDSTDSDVLSLEFTRH
jgi:hypothetical protein